MTTTETNTADDQQLPTSAPTTTTTSTTATSDLSHHTTTTTSDDGESASYLQRFERSMFEMRLNYPIAFNLTMLNTLFGSYVMSAMLRRRNKAYLPLGTSITLVSSTVFLFAYARSYSSKFERTIALPVRPDVVGVEVAAKENEKLQQEKRKEVAAQFVSDARRKLDDLRKEFNEELSKEKQQMQSKESSKTGEAEKPKSD